MHEEKYKLTVNHHGYNKGDIITSNIESDECHHFFSGHCRYFNEKCLGGEEKIGCILYLLKQNILKRNDYRYFLIKKER